MDGLLLNNLEIRNFRAFRHLRIEHLGRVNLVVGKNSVGKTCLLEALMLYAHRGSQTSLIEITASRDETTMLASGEAIRVEDRLDAFGNLFFNRRKITTASETIQIGPIDSQEQRLSIGIGLHTETHHGNTGISAWKLLGPDEYHTVDSPTQLLDVQMGRGPGIAYALDTDFLRLVMKADEKKINTVFINARGLNVDQIVHFWDSIALTDLESQVLEALRIISPNIERVNLISNRFHNSARIPIVKMTDLTNPIPLKSLGEGMLRVFDIALAIVNAKDGLLLIDEIESGLHYSVQVELWRLILKTARRLNVQVFATTHSWDCIEAFQKATQEDQEEGLLIRLGRKQGDVIATLFDEQELAVVTREEIEVR